MYDENISEENPATLVTASRKAVVKLGEAVFPGAKPVNLFPVLEHLPSWFPGTGFKKFSQDVRVLTDYLRNVPFDFVKEQMVLEEFFSYTLLEEHNAQGGSSQDEEDIKDVLATAFAAKNHL
ncbi:hypothetical protein H0H81_010509 [Sphagnurus paluster]|uniref:Uncharacterized protein n=1 Tax=Sphagnurus paluster TaxID=117069 RepID=A0A9P7K3Z8_9AGAR|nr:hypothetical protein H0H81_010509 [Sphagnurus paluster]